MHSDAGTMRAAAEAARAADSIYSAVMKACQTMGVDRNGMYTDVVGRILDACADAVESGGACDAHFRDAAKLVEPPLDRDGVPCMIGDDVWRRDCDGWHGIVVQGVGEKLVYWHDVDDGKINACLADDLTHAKPRTLDDVVHEMDLMTDGDPERVREQFRELVREAFGLGEEAAR